MGNNFQKYCFYLRINISKLNRSNIAIKEDSTFQLDMFSIAYVIAIGKTMVEIAILNGKEKFGAS